MFDKVNHSSYQSTVWKQKLMFRVSSLTLIILPVSIVFPCYFYYVNLIYGEIKTYQINRFYMVYLLHLNIIITL